MGGLDWPANKILLEILHLGSSVKVVEQLRISGIKLSPELSYGWSILRVKEKNKLPQNKLKPPINKLGVPTLPKGPMALS